MFTSRLCDNFHEVGQIKKEPSFFRFARMVSVLRLVVKRPSNYDSNCENAIMIDVVELLSDLVKIPSINPMGRNLEGSDCLEHGVSKYLQTLFERLGLPFERHEVEPGRENIIARLEGDGRLVMLEAHQDTVPVDGMTIPPFSAESRDGRVFGRGACDVKGGIACMLAAIARLADERLDNMPTIVLACTVDEEHGMKGATHLSKLLSNAKSRLLPRIPDAAIVAEPTKLDVVVAHKGVVRWKCHATGRACHSSRPEQGENAIYKMGRVLAALEHYANEVVPRIGDHPLLGQPSLSVGTITGGISVNAVPDRCTVEIDRRLLPGEDPNVAFQHAVDFVSKNVSVDGTLIHDPPTIAASGLSDSHNADLASELGSAAKARGASGQRVAVPYGTNAPHYAAISIPTVVFGPGSIEQAHTKDEWIAIDQLKLATQILVDFIKTRPS